jgi:acyl CoA:acetate/3-ketoacid CoA transferase alpha subunit
MAMAADYVVAETTSLEALGGIGPDHVHTPSAFVSAVVEIADESARFAAQGQP